MVRIRHPIPIITEAHLAADAVTSVKIKAGEVGPTDLSMSPLSVIQNYVHSAGDVDTITLSGLDLVSHERYRLFITLVLDGSTAMGIYLNGDSTGLNYDNQRLNVNGANVTAEHRDDFLIGYMSDAADKGDILTVDVCISAHGYACMHTICSSYNIPQLEMHTILKSNATVVNITSITLDVLSGAKIQNGSRILLMGVV